MENQEAKNEALIGGSGLNAGLGGWISISDRLPDDDCKCLIASWFTLDNRQQIEVGAFRSGSKRFNVECTHWMPLPAPPNVEVSERPAQTNDKQP